ncbi:MAG: LacI family DNA-binding transcriptional regulator [Oscillospiraceae bacterium]|nr:LacI family DNA-binding transcriptional regulator [Oscillospiraceae bacterium]
MATLADIAKLCGTSTATVSYVLSGQGDRRRISPEMQEQVRKAAEQLHYKQRESAPKNSALKIALLWPDKNLETTIGNVISGINTALQFESTPIELSMVPFGFNSLSSHTALWSARVYDAVMILSPNVADMEILEQRHTKIPTVLINRSLEGYSGVSSDNDEVGRLSAAQAVAKAGEDIALIYNTTQHMGMNQRSRAIYQACKSYGISLDDKVFYCNNSIDEAYELGVRMLRQKMLPKLILCVYDTVAFGLIRALNEGGIQVGKEVEVLTASTSTPQFFARATPSITVVDMKIKEISQRALHLAVDLVYQRVPSPTQIVIEPELIYRESSPPPTIEQTQRLIEYKRKYMMR